MVKESYVDFDTAKLLKEKGFDEECRGFFHTAFESPRLSTWNIDRKNSDYKECVSSPTYQMVMAWLRAKHNIMVEIYLPHEYEHEEEIWDGKYCFELFSLTNGHSIFWDETEYSTYEDAVEAACVYSLENLI